MILDVHDGAIVGVIVGQRSAHIVVANSAEDAEPPFPGTATVRAVRDTIFAIRVAHTPSEAVAVGVRAVLYVTAARRRHDGHHRITPLHKSSIEKACLWGTHGKVGLTSLNSDR